MKDKIFDKFHPKDFEVDLKTSKQEHLWMLPVEKSKTGNCNTLISVSVFIVALLSTLLLVFL